MPKSVGAKGFLLGLLLFAGTELVWLVIAQASGVSRWVMKPLGAVALVMMVYFLGAAFFAASARPGCLGLAGLAGGAAIGVASMLMLIGPGNMWPFVLVIDLAALLLAVLVGFACGLFVRAAEERARLQREK